MIVSKIQENEKSILNLEGRLDTATAPLLENALIASFDEAKQVELDFTKLDYISSAGLRVLLMGLKTAQSKGAYMTLRSVSEDIKQIFEITGFDRILTIL